MLIGHWQGHHSLLAGAHIRGSDYKLQNWLVPHCSVYVQGSQQMVHQKLARFDLLMKYALGQTGRRRQIRNVAICP